MKRHILCINNGSSSIKFALYATGDGEETTLGSGAVERIGQSAGRICLQREGQGRVDRTDRFPDQRSRIDADFLQHIREYLRFAPLASASGDCRRRGPPDGLARHPPGGLLRHRLSSDRPGSGQPPAPAAQSLA